ncbi:response regulator [Hymenobacter crusticola]|uniref:DNA-binding response regulator n=1 Tax=Hymenobacter crusticola TaxID=1770526 RepID=A0A243WEC9_9BACT|nr:response regulator [Hymenobacter crusticola]OUJ74078.1 DNA-binding response regulator [Hymenobacter crusticola]
MVDHRVHILIVEDEAVLAMDLCDTLEAEGYVVVGTASNGRRALELFQKNQVDLLLCDVNIKGEWDGIETAARLLALRLVPVIYLTALADKETLDRALGTAPAAYLTKPATTAGLRAAIEVALRAFVRQATPEAVAPAGPSSAPEPPSISKDALSRETILQLGEYVFIKDNYQFVRIPVKDILLLEANNTYTTLVTPARKYALRLTLSTVLERLNYTQLVRTHRSYAVNIQHIQSFNENETTLAGQAVPLGRQYKDAFLRHFQFH